jgi:hypothetical protein
MGTPPAWCFIRPAHNPPAPSTSDNPTRHLVKGLSANTCVTAFIWILGKVPDWYDGGVGRIFLASMVTRDTCAPRSLVAIVWIAGTGTR